MADPRASSYAATGAALARMLAAGPHSARRRATEALERAQRIPELDDMEAPDPDRWLRQEDEEEAERNWPDEAVFVDEDPGGYGEDW